MRLIVRTYGRIRTTLDLKYSIDRGKRSEGISAALLRLKMTNTLLVFDAAGVLLAGAGPHVEWPAMSANISTEKREYPHPLSG